MGWTVRGSNPGGGEIFHTCPDRPWGPSSLLYNGYRVFPGGKERPGRDADPSIPSSAVGHERVELYRYSPYGSYGLYRASVPAQGCTLPLLTILQVTSIAQFEARTVCAVSMFEARTVCAVSMLETGARCPLGESM